VGRQPLSREIVERHQRERVLGVAIDVFAKRGYWGTNVSHIVTAAKIGTPSFQALFGDKEGCFLQAYDRIIAIVRERVAATVDPEQPWPRRLRTAMQLFLELIEGTPLEARIVLVEAQTAGDTALGRYQANLDEVAALLRQGRAYGGLRDDQLPTSLEFVIVSGLFSFLQQRIVAGEAADVTALLPEVMEIVAEPYLGREATLELLAA
jgi:AcrR family transcriptional regulator